MLTKIRLTLILSAALLVLGGAAHAQELVDWINRYRAEVSSSPVVETPDARLVAYAHNGLVIEANKSGHYYGYSGLREALDRYQVDYDFISEAVIYFGRHETRWEYILSIFRASEPHWNSLMRERFTHMSYNLRHTSTESAITIYMIERR